MFPVAELGFPFEYQLSKPERFPPIVPNAPFFQPGSAFILLCKAFTFACNAAIESFFGACSAFSSSNVCAFEYVIANINTIAKITFLIMFSIFC